MREVALYLQIFSGGVYPPSATSTHNLFFEGQPASTDLCSVLL